MNPLARIPYAAAGSLARGLAFIAPSGNSKTARSLNARRGLLRRYSEWGALNRDSSRPLLWIHAPSVGEGLQALPVIELFRASHPTSQLAYTFFSPSAENFSGKIGADFHDYLPFDTARNAREVLAALRPTALVFSKLDVWPLLVETAARKGVRLGMLSATMPASSYRRSRLARLVLGEAYSLLDAVGAISSDDAERLIQAGVRPDRITVTGDTRYDQAWAKANTDSTEHAGILAPLKADNRFTMVAGSTWPSDEEHLLAAWVSVKRKHPGIRLIIAPHEVSESRVASMEAWARANALTSQRLGDAQRAADVLIVARYGILGDLYALADVAYVGGGFRRAGLHSLLEPAAFGAPVIIGTRHGDNRDAQLLVAAGGAFRCADRAAMEKQISRLIESPDYLASSRAAARATVEQGLGAAERSVQIVEQLMQPQNQQKRSQTPV